MLKSRPCPASLSPAEFSIWTREAGAGGLSIAVEGPSKAEIAFEDRKDGSCGVSYVVQEPGGCPHWVWACLAFQSGFLFTQAGGGATALIRHLGPCFLCSVSLHPTPLGTCLSLQS